jgi:predicted ArsR family transcriptional regulator
MRIVIKILASLGTVFGVLAGYLISDGQKTLAFKCLTFAIIFLGLDAILVIASYVHKTPYEPQRLFKRPLRKNLPPQNTSHVRPPPLKPTADIAAHTPNPTPPLPDPRPLSSKPDEYKPDELAGKILLHIYRAQWPDPVEDLPKELNVEPLEIEVRLDKLMEHHYVENHQLAPIRGSSPYRLSAKGREYIVANGLLAKSEPPQPADFKPDELCVKILKLIHRTPSLTSLMEFVAALKEDIVLIAPRLDKLLTYKYVTRVNEHPMSSLERSPYILTPKGVKYLDETPVRNIPFPTREAPRVLRYVNAYHPDDVDNAILLYMYEVDTPRLLQQIVEKFRLNTHEARYKMNRLKEGGYVSHVFNASRNLEGYLLTDEGVEYILWIKPT